MTNPDGGESWDNAFHHLRDALLNGELVAGDEIWVAEGIYYPDEDCAMPGGNSDEAATFTLVEGVKLLGGFDGVESTLAERAGLFEQTILSGDLGILGDQSDNAWHIVTADGITGSPADTVLDGFLITLGRAQNDDLMPGSGAGMLLASSAINIVNCTFELNVAGLDYGGGFIVGLGGAILALDSALHIESSTFRCNESLSNSAAEQGGGAVGSLNSTLSMNDCLFTGNSSGWHGGAILQDIGGDLMLTNCAFTANVAAANGGAIYFTSDGLLCQSVQFHENQSIHGGGVFFRKSALPVFSRCRFSSNVAAGGNGGAVYGSLALPAMLNCTLTNNSALEQGQGISGRGGAIFIDIPFVGAPTPGALTNCTIADNYCDGGAGGIELSTSSMNALSLSNCILWNNTGDGGVQAENEQIRPVDPPTFPVRYTCIQNSILFELTEPGVINGNPQFINAALNNYRLAANTSACLDAGDSQAAVSASLTVDLDGDARRDDDVIKVDTGLPPTPIVDMGAYEYVCPSGCTGDANRDRQVNITDLNLVLGNFPSTGLTECTNGDVNGDGAVNITDINHVLGNFSAVCNPNDAPTGTCGQQEAASGGSGSQQAGSVGSTLVEQTNNVPAYLIYLGWTSEADYAAWLAGLSETDRLIHSVELLQAYESAGE